MGRFIIFYLLIGCVIFTMKIDVYDEVFNKVGSKNMDMKFNKTHASIVYVIGAIVVILIWPLWFKDLIGGKNDD